MKAKELMVGNYVYRLGEITIVNGVHKSMNGIDYVTTIKSGTISENQIYPIQLDKEFILKF